MLEFARLFWKDQFKRKKIQDILDRIALGDPELILPAAEKVSKRMQKKKNRNPPEIEDTEFHNVKKALRRLLGYQVLMLVLKPTEASAGMHRTLFALHQEMAKIHDEFVSKALLGELNYDESFVETDPVLRSRVLEFLEKLRLETVLESP